MHSKLISTPIGPITILAEDDAIIGLYFGDTHSNKEDLSHSNKEDSFPCGGVGDSAFSFLTQCESELNSYFAGKLKQFTVPICARGTPFREKVWAALYRIPYCETVSYMNIAADIGNPKSVRAVGGANHHNPISIIIPCHRVIGADGALTGYGGGLDIKKWLLELEEKHK